MADAPPNAPELVHHVSAPPLGQFEGIMSPSLGRSFSAPSCIGSASLDGRQRFTDRTLEILLQPSQIERSPSSQPATESTSVSVETPISSIQPLAYAEKSSTELLKATDEQTQRFVSNFGVATASELALCWNDPTTSPENDPALIHLSIGQYTALHKSTGLPLMVGDTVTIDDSFHEASELIKGSQEIEGIVDEVEYRDNATHVTIKCVAIDGDGTSLLSIKRCDTYGDRPRVWAFKIKSLVPRVADEVWLRSDIPSIEPQSSSDGEQCCICLESHPTLLKNICERPGELGLEDREATAACDVQCCIECFEAHVSHSISSAKFSVAPIRCPGSTCGRRLPMERWTWAVSKQPEDEISPLQSYLHNPVSLCNIRCPYCDQVESIFEKPKLGHKARTEAMHSYGIHLSSLQFSQLESLWFKFAHGDIAATDMVEALVHIVPPSNETASQFLEEKENVAPAFLGNFMTEALLPMIVDVERRCALQLAWLRRFPKIEMIGQVCKCCSPLCFKCKVEGHHLGQTCAERQAEELNIEAQYCPACGVATVRSEGCDHIVCVCGAHWTWEGDDNNY